MCLVAGNGFINKWVDIINPKRARKKNSTETCYYHQSRKDLNHTVSLYFRDI